MGSSWSDEAKESSNSQQAQQVSSHPKQESIASPNHSGKLVLPNTTSNKVHITPKGAMKASPKLPHNCEAVIKDSDRPIDKSSLDKLYEQLHAGVFLNGRKKKYWVEKKGNINCFMVFANDLAITWSENPSHWYLHNMEPRSHAITLITSVDPAQIDQGNITVAQLRNVCWLEVHGKFKIANLTPGVTYQIAYLIKLEASGYGWEVPVNLRLTLPNGTKQEHKVSLKEKPKEEWVRVPVGEFKVSPENSTGEVEFLLYEYEGGIWKKGLVIKGAIIEPKI